MVITLGAAPMEAFAPSFFLGILLFSGVARPSPASGVSALEFDFEVEGVSSSSLFANDSFPFVAAFRFFFTGGVELEILYFCCQYT